MLIKSKWQRVVVTCFVAGMVCASMSCFGKKTNEKPASPETTPIEPAATTKEPQPSTVFDIKPNVPTIQATEFKTLTLDLGDGIKMELVLIPAGEFMMGSNYGRFGEKPVHKVTISDLFYLSKYEVTQEQHEEVMGTNPSHFKGAKNPVEQISWDDAQEFCKRLSKNTGYTISLPTEAQWEYACRAGTMTKWHFGDDESVFGDYAWFFRNSGDKTITSDYDYEYCEKNNCGTQPVGMKRPNGWGLYDMYGNVFEWCQDWTSYYENSPASNPSGALSGSSRVARGGSWNGKVLFGSATRHGFGPGSRNNYLGFRVVAVPKE